jgi:dipeptidyl aminopeptidase/acylaminoacyl peptidase
MRVQEHTRTTRPRRLSRRILALFLLVGIVALPAALTAQDILSSQLRTGFGKNKVRYKDFEWWILESEHLELYYEPEFDDLAHQAVAFLEEAYDHISEITRHELSAKPPIVIFKSHYEFQQTNIIHAFLPPGVAGFAEPLRYRMVIPFNGDLDEFNNVLTHELMHIFQYDIIYKGPIKRLSSPLRAPPTWIMEGLAEYSTVGRNTIDEMVLRDAVLTDELIPLEVMDAFWGSGNVFLAYKQSHSLMEYIAANYGPEKVSRILRVWDSQSDTNKLLERLIDMDMETLHERWSAHMRKQYWPLLQSRDYLSEIAQKVAKKQSRTQAFVNPEWSLSGDMLAVLTTDGVEQNVDIIRLGDGSLVARASADMFASDYDQLTFGEGTVAWAPDGHTIAFVGKKGPQDRIFFWDLYDKELKGHLIFDDIEIIESIDWSPDSSRMVFVGTGYGQSDLYIADVASGDLRQLTGTPQREDHPDWSPDGKRIAYSAKQGGQFDIRVIDVESGNSRRVVQSPVDDVWPNWLPEGNKLLFVSTREKINDLFIHHLETGEEYRLTRTISGVMNPALSPDGKQVVLSTYYHGRRELYRMDMPSWPDVKKRDAELLARTGVAEPAVVTVVDPQQMETADPQGDTPSPKVLPALGEAVALLEQSPEGQGNTAKHNTVKRNTVKLAHMSQADPTSLSGDQGDGTLLGGAVASLASADSGSGGGRLFASQLPRRRYTPKLDFDGVALQMGYFDGFLSSVAQLSMSDLLGNHSLSLATDYVASQEIDNDFNFAVAYVYYGKRPTYSASIFNWNQFFNDRESTTYIYRGSFVKGLERSRQSGLLVDMSYPLDVYRRVDMSYTFVDEQRELVWPVTEPRESFSTHLFRASYVHDSITYGLLGPTMGRRYFISLGRTLSLTDGDRSFSHLEADYRSYRRLGRWSVFGLRLLGVGSLGNDGLAYNLGGPAWFLPFFSGFNLNQGPLRGYQYSELSGSRLVLLNAEVRVPFIRNITFGWPGTFAIPAVDGSFFLDVGTAWNRGEDLKLWPLYQPDSGVEPVGERRLRASVGFGTLVYFILPMNLEFARQTDLQGNYSEWKFHFSFGSSF